MKVGAGIRVGRKVGAGAGVRIGRRSGAGAGLRIGKRRMSIGAGLKV